MGLNAKEDVDELVYFSRRKASLKVAMLETSDILSNLYVTTAHEATVYPHITSKSSHSTLQEVNDLINELYDKIVL